MKRCAIKKGTTTSCPVKARQSPWKTRKQCPRRGTDFHAFFHFKTGDFDWNAKSSVNFQINCHLGRLGLHKNKTLIFPYSILIRAISEICGPQYRKRSPFSISKNSVNPSSLKLRRAGLRYSLGSLLKAKVKAVNFIRGRLALAGDGETF